jgi:hypothetical protein
MDSNVGACNKLTPPPPLEKKQSVTQTFDVSTQVSLGKFSLFDRERCRWRIDGGDEASECTPDEYGQRRRRGWINLKCDPSPRGRRAEVLEASEPSTCEYELTVASAELC